MEGKCYNAYVTAPRNGLELNLSAHSIDSCREMVSSHFSELRLRTIYSATMARWLSGLFLVATCAFLLSHFWDSLWTTSIDLAHHYALVARLSEHWNLPTSDDPSLEEMNVYPRYAHRLAAIVGTLVGSPLLGMQFVALASLAAVWSGLGFVLLSLPRRARWLLLGILSVVLLLNRLFVHLELFGNEIVANYFFPQLVSQGIATLLIALVLWLERARTASLMRYLILGCSVPLLQQFHLLPALELLAMLALLLALDVSDRRTEGRWRTFALGLLTILGSFLLTVLSSTFATMLHISENNGVLILNYTPNLMSLAIECVLASALSGLLIWQWMHWRAGEPRRDALALKYLGLLGFAVAGPCLLQIALFMLGYGSEYACKKYAFGLNTVLVLDLALLFTLPISRLRGFFTSAEETSLGRAATVLQSLFPSLLVLLAFLTIFPSPSDKAISLTEVVAAERSVRAYDQANPPSSAAKYDYAIGLFPDLRILDYLISIGVLKAPRVDNADDMLNGYPPSKPRKISRIYTREGITAWDVPECRQAVLQGGIVVLDGACVLEKMNAAGIEAAP